MKSYYSRFAGMILAVIISFGCAQAHNTIVAEPYFTSKEMPDMLQMPIAPPAENSATFAYDVQCYFWGKEQRLNPERAAIAIRDADYGLETIVREFSSPLGIQISWQHTPKIYKLLLDALATTDSICKLPKEFYMRTRPFVFFSEKTLTEKDDDKLRMNGSFPSGHTILGYSAALLMAEINPERADTILSRGLMFGESRVIVGAHWQSDVNAGYLAASMAYAKLHTSERFLKQMAAARKEFAKLKDQYPPLKDHGFFNDPSYLEYKKEIANLKAMEQSLQCKIQRYPFGFDETTGLKMLYIKANESPYGVGNGVSHIILTNDKNEVVYVVQAVLRHDREGADDSLYGLYVVGRDKEGEIEISRFDVIDLERLLFQMGPSPKFVNCTKIKYKVSPLPHLIPFSPVTEENKEKYHRFFRE